MPFVADTCLTKHHAAVIVVHKGLVVPRWLLQELIFILILASPQTLRLDESVLELWLKDAVCGSIWVRPIHNWASRGLSAPFHLVIGRDKAWKLLSDLTLLWHLPDEERLDHLFVNKVFLSIQVIHEAIIFIIYLVHGHDDILLLLIWSLFPWTRCVRSSKV